MWTPSRQFDDVLTMVHRGQMDMAVARLHEWTVIRKISRREFRLLLAAIVESQATVIRTGDDHDVFFR